MKENSHKSPEISFVSSLAEASFLLRRVAEPRPAGDSVKSALSRAWRRLPGWSYNRIRDVWHADARIRISADELDALRSTARKQKAEDARQVFREAKDLIARLEQCIRLQNPNMDRDALTASFLLARGEDSPLGE